MDIAALRQELDRIDADMLDLLDRRIDYARRIAAAKREAGLPARDRGREEQMLAHARAGRHELLSADEAARFIELLLSFSRSGIRRRDAAPAPMKVAIIGLGLIGGSLARALLAAQPGHTLRGVDLSDRLAAPLDSGLFANVVPPERGEEVVKDADVVFLCTPLSRTLELLPALAEDTPRRAIVTDVCGVKQAVVAAAGQAFAAPDAAYFVGGHPMAGRERTGFEHADALLFDGRPWVLTPSSYDPLDKLRALQSLIESTGAELHLMTPREHDRAMACVSHLPQLLSTALMLTVGDRGDRLAGPALRDMTRLASSPAAMWNDLTSRLRTELEGEMHSLKSYLTQLEMAVHFGEPLDKWFNRANRLRAGLEGVAPGPGGE
jgi:prephenate dehydrogenase